MAKYNEWLEEENLELIRMWRRDGLTEEEIARNKIDVAYSTFREWKKKFPAISAALKNGKEHFRAEIENPLLKAAKEGNLTAIIFILKTRFPEIWAEVKKIELSGEMQNNGMLQLVNSLEKARSKKE